jgi:hypothetical protein
MLILAQDLSVADWTPIKTNEARTNSIQRL